MNAHPTEGPWRISEQNDDETTIVGPNHLNDEECEYIATVIGIGTDETNIGHANARLIAAAPLLYKALQDIAAKIETRFGMTHELATTKAPIGEIYREIFYALAAARGE